MMEINSISGRLKEGEVVRLLQEEGEIPFKVTSIEKDEDEEGRLVPTGVVFGLAYYGGEAERGARLSFDPSPDRLEPDHSPVGELELLP